MAWHSLDTCAVGQTPLPELSVVPSAASLQGSPVRPQGHIVHNWKARWFILRQNTLLYYKLDGGRKVTPPKGRILLDGCTITCPCLEYENRPVSEGPCSPALDSPTSGLFGEGGVGEELSYH